MDYFCFSARAIAKVALPLIVAGVAVSGCQTGGRTDNTGRSINFTGKRTIDLAETDLDIPAHMINDFSEVSEEIRNNVIVHNTYLFKFGGGYIISQRIKSRFSYFPDRSVSRSSAMATLDQRMARIFKDEPVGRAREMEVVNHPKVGSGGYYRVYDSDNGSRSCIAADVKYEFSFRALEGTASNPRDTAISVVYCGRTKIVNRIIKMLKTVAVVTDRTAFRMAIAGRNTTDNDTAAAKPAAAKKVVAKKPRIKNFDIDVIKFNWAQLVPHGPFKIKGREDRGKGRFEITTSNQFTLCSGNYVRQDKSWSLKCKGKHSSDGSFINASGRIIAAGEDSCGDLVELVFDLPN